MSIPPVAPVTRAAFFPRPKSSRYFSPQQTNQPTNRRHIMSNNNTDTITISENSEDKDTTVTIPLQFTAKLGVPQELIDERDRALRRFKWTMMALVGGYIALNIYVAYLQVYGAS